MKLIKDLEAVSRGCKTNSEKFAVDRAIRVVKAWLENTTEVDSAASYLDQRVAELEQFLKDAHTENKQLCDKVEELRQTNKDLARAALKPELNESQDLEQAIETIQVALSGSFRDNLKVEVTEQHAWLVYGNLKFLVEPIEAWQAVQSCVYLSGLEVDNEI